MSFNFLQMVSTGQAKLRLLRGALLFMPLLAALVAGCSEVEEDLFDEIQSDTRLINAIYDGPALDLVADNSLVWAGVPYGGSQLRKLTIGNYDMALLPTQYIESDTLVERSYTFDSNRDYTYIAFGLLEGDFELLRIEDRGEGQEAGMARVNFFNAQPFATTALTLAFIPVREDGSLIEGGEPQYSATQYAQSQSFIALSPGDYRLRISDTSGTTLFESDVNTISADDDLFFVAIPNPSQDRGDIVLVEASGQPDQASSDSRLLFEAGTQASLRALHGATDFALVDVSLNSTLTFDDLAFASVAPGAQSYSEVAPAEYSWTIEDVSGGSSTSFTTEEDLELEPGLKYTALITDAAEGSEDGFRVFVLEDSSRGLASQATLRVIRSSSQDSLLDLYFIDVGDSLGDVNPGVSDISDLFVRSNLPASPGTYDLVITEANGSTELLRRTVTFEDGEVYTLVLFDEDTAGGVQLVELDGPTL